MIRFVKGPEGQLVPDIAEKLPGRGVWVTATAQVLDAAIHNGGFKRGLKSKVEIRDDLAAQTQELLKARVLSLMTMSLKAGQAYIGFDQVKSAAQSNLLAWRIEATDGSEGGRGKIRVLTKAVSREFGQNPTPVIGCFGASELGKAFGRTDLVHAAIKAGPMAPAFNRAVSRLAGFCELVPEIWADRAHEAVQIKPEIKGDNS